jgi:hypothetical protein
MGEAAASCAMGSGTGTGQWRAFNLDGVACIGEPSLVK